jgi:uncharacterized protein YndB with AHSA1/START domain
MPDTTTTVTTSFVVDAPIDRAFTVFTRDIGSWWPPDHHILESELAEMVFEPYVGGNIYDRGVDGSECRWARVLTYDPPNAVVFSWDINLAWQVESDPSKASEVAVTFSAEAPGRTRIDLEHRHLDRHGDGWEAMRAAVGSQGGWSATAERLAERLAADPAISS